MPAIAGENLFSLSAEGVASNAPPLIVEGSHGWPEV
jgi:hypothetical protein